MVKRVNRFSIILKSFFIISDAVHVISKVAVHVRSKRLATKLKSIKFRNRKDKIRHIKFIHDFFSLFHTVLDIGINFLSTA